MFTTLNQIQACSPCEDGWRTLLSSLKKTHADDVPVSIRHIIESNGVEDAIWALRAVDGHDREIRLYAASCAEQVLPLYEQAYPNDNRPRYAIQAARDYANGLIDYAARAAARDAAGAAAWATARDAAWAAARDAARDAQKTELIRVCECIEHGIDPYPIDSHPQP